MCVCVHVRAAAAAAESADLFMVLGVAIFNKYLSSWSYRSLFYFTQMLLVFANLLDLIWVKRWNLTLLGLPDKYEHDTSLSSHVTLDTCSDLDQIDPPLWYLSGPEVARRC